MKVALTISMLVVSNVFMTWAWYGHLKKGSAADDKPLLLIILMSWGRGVFRVLLHDSRQPPGQCGRP